MTWRVPYTGFPQQFKELELQLTEAFKRVMSEGAFILRDDVRQFEENMASYLGIKHVIGVNSGTDALYLSLRALGIDEGDEVITVKHTFVATISAIRSVGATPVFADIQDDYCMSPDSAKSKISDKTKAILPVHLNGRMCDMPKIMQLGLPVVEDACQALGSSIDGIKAGAWGITGCFSTHPMKTLGGCGDGGFISTNSDEINEQLRSLRNHKGQPYGFNSRLDNLQAALLNVKFQHLDNAINVRRTIALTYDKAFKDLPVRRPPKPNGSDHFDTFNSYVLADGALREHLRNDGVEAFSHLSDDVTSLPIYPEMTPKQVAEVIVSVRDFYA